MRARSVQIRLDEAGYVILSDPHSLCYGTGRTINRAMKDYINQLLGTAAERGGRLSEHMAARVEAAEKQLAALGVAVPKGKP